MLVALIAKDKADALDTRLKNRAAHVEHLKSGGLVAQAGPLLNANGEMCGSLVIFDVESVAQVQEWAAADPYAKADLFESVEIIPWNRVIG
ncbi:YciI family protein [Aliiruegeria sabulilitoris]|uniref:YciI family protein n=1 Tax=Aliiruegeria sabulilitoris TaxID=1510458 RepID=UPI00082F2945|nr:YciI family protein [Aliiruegeria sabulilitoris]NDR57622.1 YciI family protein [Pseudoruegeria sp. M32A2M]